MLQFLLNLSALSDVEDLIFLHLHYELKLCYGICGLVSAGQNLIS